MEYLVIGYGNSLRGDDGAGQWIAEQVENWHLDNVRSLALHQLTPEVAADIAAAGTVIFVDAVSYETRLNNSLCRGERPFAPTENAITDQPDLITPTEPAIAQIQVLSVQAEETPTHWAHFQDPRSLLALTQRVYGITPASWWILIPAVDFEFGEQFSAIAQQGITDALNWIQELVNQSLK